MDIQIGLLGLGTVGTGVYQLLEQHGDRIAEQCGGARPRVRKVLVRDPRRNRNLVVDPGVLTQDASAILDDPDVKIVIELMGGTDPAGRYVETALSRGKHVVTANKELVARQGPALLSLAQSKELALLFEAAVTGGIPILRAVRESLNADRIVSLRGIVNGTTNYILTRMTRDRLDFAEALQGAQDKGYAEPDPTNDVQGVDAMYKLAILVSMAFGTPVDIAGLDHRGIADVHLTDIEYARDLGFVVKLLAEAREEDGAIFAGVGPCMVTSTHPLASVLDNFNAVLVSGAWAGDLMFYGQGAGSRPTATAVVSDLIEVCQNIAAGNRHAWHGGYWKQTSKTVLPLWQQKDRYYLRLRVPDRPGVLASIATLFAEEGVSFHSVLQKSHGEDPVDLVLMTHAVSGKAIRKATERLRGTHEVAAAYRVI